MAAAQANCGPKISLTQNIPNSFLFSDDVGSIQTIGLNTYRVNSASFSESSVGLTSTAFVTIEQWNEICSYHF